MHYIKKTIDILKLQRKKSFFLLLISIFFTAFFETIGIFSILPFIAVLSNPNVIETNIILYTFYQKLSIVGVTNKLEFLFILGLLFLIVLSFSIFLRVVNHYMQIRFSLMFEHTISKILMEKYIRQPYIWFLNRNSSELGKNILSDVYHLTNHSVIPVCNIISYGTLIFFVIVLLLFVNPTITIYVGLILSISYFSIFYLSKKIIFVLGTKRQQSNQDRFNSVFETFGAAKEIKLSGLENFFTSRFEKFSKSYAKSQTLTEIISAIPRNFIEAIGFGGVIIFILILVSKGKKFDDFIPIITLYVFAGYRLLPSLHNVYYAINQLNFSSQVLNSIHKNLMSLKFKDSSNNFSKIFLTQSINMNSIYFHYSNINNMFIKNINLSIPAYSKVGIVGPSGSGKTTIIDIILGLLDPYKGTLRVDDNIINENNKNSWQKNIGYVPQQIYLLDKSVAENIAFGSEIHNINYDAVEFAAKTANIHDFIIKELPNGYSTIIGERGARLSGGERQRLAIARALYHSPQVLILDEATSALDNITEDKILSLIDQLAKKITIIMVAHRLNTIKSCDIIFLIDKGELKAKGTYDELYASNQIFQKMSKNI